MLPLKGFIDYVHSTDGVLEVYMLAVHFSPK